MTLQTHTKTDIAELEQAVREASALEEILAHEVSSMPAKVQDAAQLDAYEAEDREIAELTTIIEREDEETYTQLSAIMR